MGYISYFMGVVNYRLRVSHSSNPFVRWTGIFWLVIAEGDGEKLACLLRDKTPPEASDRPYMRRPFSDTSPQNSPIR